MADDGRYRPRYGYNHHVHPRPHMFFDYSDHTNEVMTPMVPQNPPPPTEDTYEFADYSYEQFWRRRYPNAYLNHPHLFRPPPTNSYYKSQAFLDTLKQQNPMPPPPIYYPKVNFSDPGVDNETEGQIQKHIEVNGGFVPIRNPFGQGQNQGHNELMLTPQEEFNIPHFMPPVPMMTPGHFGIPDMMPFYPRPPHMMAMPPMVPQVKVKRNRAQRKSKFYPSYEMPKALLTGAPVFYGGRKLDKGYLEDQSEDHIRYDHHQVPHIVQLPNGRGKNLIKIKEHLPNMRDHFANIRGHFDYPGNLQFGGNQFNSHVKSNMQQFHHNNNYQSNIMIPKFENKNPMKKPKPNGWVKHEPQKKPQGQWIENEWRPISSEKIEQSAWDIVKNRLEQMRNEVNKAQHMEISNVLDEAEERIDKGLGKMEKLLKIRNSYHKSINDLAPLEVKRAKLLKMLKENFKVKDDFNPSAKDPYLM